MIGLACIIGGVLVVSGIVEIGYYNHPNWFLGAIHLVIGAPLFVGSLIALML